MFPNYNVTTACGSEGPGRLKLKNGLTVQADTTIEVLKATFESEPLDILIDNLY